MQLCEGLILLGLLEHFVEGFDFYVGDGDLPLLHQVVLQGLDLDAVLGVHHLNGLRETTIFFFGCFREQFFQAADALCGGPLGLSGTLFKVLVVFGQFFSLFGVAFADAFQLAERGLELELEGAVVAGLFL
jgi:hypothetical protein